MEQFRRAREGIELDRRQNGLIQVGLILMARTDRLNQAQEDICITTFVPS